MAPLRDRRVALIALAMLVVGLATPFIWFRIASSGLVRQVRAMEDRAMQVIERLRVPELELYEGPQRMEEAQIRTAWALSLIGSPELLQMLFQDDPYWQPGRGVWVHTHYRSSLSTRQTCLQLAKRIGEPASRCPPGDREDYEYWIPIRAEGADGGVTIYPRRLRDGSGVLEKDFSAFVDFAVKVCGTLREPGTGSCP